MDIKETNGLLLDSEVASFDTLESVEEAHDNSVADAAAGAAAGAVAGVAVGWAAAAIP